MKSRREFHKTVAALATTAAVVGVDAASAQPDANPTAAAADSLFALIRARYGNFLDAEQLEQVRRSVRNRQAAADILKRVPLKNSDEPAFVFSADVT